MLLDGTEENSLVFNGDDGCTSFIRFVEDLRSSLPASDEESMVDLIPTRLYGTALRTYESLPVKCQQNCDDLMFAMTWSFPGWVRGTFASTTSLLTGLTPTTLAAPPPTSLTFTREKNDTTNSEQESPLSRLLGNLSLGPLLKARGDSQLTPQIVVHSLYLDRVDDLESDHNFKVVTRLVEIPLSDKQAVSKAAKEPILTITAKEAGCYRVGFTFVINFGVLWLASTHSVQKPSFSIPSQGLSTSNHTFNSDADEIEDDEWADFDGGKLFTNADNTPYTFTFHSTLRQYTEEREETRQLIQDNGGVVVDDEAYADIILADDKSPLYHKLYQQIIRTTTKKHVESLKWVETCIIICKVQFTRDAKRRGGRPAGKEARPFSPSEKEHIVYYLAHRSPYIPSTQRWQFSPPQSKRHNHDHVSRAGNRIWKELYESGRPWARNHPWSSYREHYYRNRAQYDVWIQRYVDKNPWLLSEVGRRLIEDLVDEPGALDDELPQEEHGHIIAPSPNGAVLISEQRSPTREMDEIAVNQSRIPFSRPVALPPDRIQPNILNLRPTAQQPHWRLERSLTPIGDDESWLINSSDEEDQMTARQPPRPVQSLFPRVAQMSSNTRNTRVRQKDRQGAVAPSHPFSRPQGQSLAEAFRQHTMQAQNSNPVPRTPERSQQYDSSTSTRGSPSTPRGEIQSRRTLGSEVDIMDLPHGLESSRPSRSPTTVLPSVEEFNGDPFGDPAPNEMHAELERQINLLYENEQSGVFDSDDVCSLEAEGHPGNSKRKKPGPSPHGGWNRQSREPKGFEIKSLSRSRESTIQSRREEIAGSVLVYHLREDGSSAMIRQNSRNGTPVMGAERTRLARDGSPSKLRTSEAS
ncbi:hypothetical protein FRC01_004963, partial [Tulasnella sp. 417]